MFSYLMTWMQLQSDRRAVTAIEYGLIASLMAVVIVAGVGIFSPALTATFTKIAADLTGA